MTCREKLKIEEPMNVGNEYIGGASGCPNLYGYLDRPSYCTSCSEESKSNWEELCKKCWDREIPEVKDSDAHKDGETNSRNVFIVYKNGFRQLITDISDCGLLDASPCFYIIKGNNRSFIPCDNVVFFGDPKFESNYQGISHFCYK